MEAFTLKDVVFWLGAILLSLLTWAGKRLHSRVDRLSKNTVTRPEFESAMVRVEKNQDNAKEERRAMHDQSTETLNRIHERVDDLWKSHYTR